MTKCTRPFWPACIRIIGGALLVLLTPGSCMYTVQPATRGNGCPRIAGCNLTD
jgi:hypothetical protein